MRSAALVMSVLAAGLAVGSARPATQEQRTVAAGTSITVDLKAPRQVIDGFGSSTRVWSDPHLANAPSTSVPADAQRAILTALYRRLGLTRARPEVDPGVQKAPGGPFDFSGKLTDAHVAFARQARPYGLTTVFPGPVYLEPWMQPNDPGSYVDWAMAMLERWRQQGYELELFHPLNEPEVANDFPAQWMHDVVLQLGRRMRAAGFKTKLVVPDDENPADAYRRAVAVLGDPAARQYVGALAYHIYSNPSVQDIVRMRQLASRYRLPLWMTEYSDKRYVDWHSSLDWAVKMHTLLTVGGVNAIDYLWGFFGDWVRPDTMLSIRFDHGQYRSFEPTPLYWITGQYSRFVKPGYRRVGTAQSSDAVLASAYRGGGRSVVVATNPGGSAQPVTIAFRRGAASGPVAAVRSSAKENWRTLAAGTVKDNRFTATLPAQSITTFVVRTR